MGSLGEDEPFEVRTAGVVTEEVDAAADVTAPFGFLLITMVLLLTLMAIPTPLPAFPIKFVNPNILFVFGITVLIFLVLSLLLPIVWILFKTLLRVPSDFIDLINLRMSSLGLTFSLAAVFFACFSGSLT